MYNNVSVATPSEISSIRCFSNWMLLPKANQQPRCGRSVSGGRGAGLVGARVAQGPYDVARRASCAPLSRASTNSARRPQPVSKRHALVARVFLGTSKVPFPSFALRLLNEPLPFLSHFGQKRFEARISCRASFLKASRRKSLIPSGGLHFPTPNERRWAEVLITDCSKLKMVGAGGLLLVPSGFRGSTMVPKIRWGPLCRNLRTGSKSSVLSTVSTRGTN